LSWTVGAYLAGTFPSALILVKAKGAAFLMSDAGRASGETDPHILMAKRLGVGWAALASTLDVLKGFMYILAARQWGHLDPAWLAMCGVVVVIGHAFPFYGRQWAGRGMAATAGVFLVLLPIEMTICGLLIVLGGVARHTSLATTLGLATVPAIAAIQAQPGQFVAMSTAIFAIIVIRRLEGLGAVTRSGIGPIRAALYRSVFDSSGPPPGHGVWDSGEGHEDLNRS
jgi:glycerol-3-phosphate acyltransferase PlsY